MVSVFSLYLGWHPHGSSSLACFGRIAISNGYLVDEFSSAHSTSSMSITSDGGCALVYLGSLFVVTLFVEEVLVLVVAPWNGCGCCRSYVGIVFVLDLPMDCTLEIGCCD